MDPISAVKLQIFKRNLLTVNIKNFDPITSGQVRKNKKEAPHDILFWKKENRGVVRQGDWKLMRFPDRPAELYNLTDDISENNNLAYKHPHKVRALFKLLFKWEGELERPMFMLKRLYEVNAMKRMDEHRNSKEDE
ncbi:hypothetical protein MHTCC0001_26700 [Flavobacteriaceae bacterium MHTCC 0001]